jgi:hypothetical protein
LFSSAGSTLATGDFNQDGKLDLAVTVTADSAEALLIGNGDGTFQNPVEYVTAGGPYSGIAADLNNDGTLDLAVVTSVGDFSVLLGNGDGTFQSHVDYAVPLTSVWMATGDLNGDGNLDLIFTSFPGGGSSGLPSGCTTYLGQGDGTFWNQGYFATGTYPVSVAIGDFNNDGLLDSVVANSGDYTISVLMQTTAVLSRTEMVFPDTRIGKSKSTQVTLSNISSNPLSISRFSLNGSGATVFSQKNNCPKSLTAGASCTITVTFAPTSSRKYLGVKLEVSDSAVSGVQTVYLSGRGLTHLPEIENSEQ